MSERMIPEDYKWVYREAEKCKFTGTQFTGLAIMQLIERIADLQAKLEEKDRIIAALESKYAFSENQELCIGYSGGCDGDLEGIEHDEGCPARPEDIKLRPHLYESSRSQEAQDEIAALKCPGCRFVNRNHSIECKRAHRSQEAQKGATS